jgi:NADPH-dependent glutamate synthase beta subunit-like oxidoreductase
VLTVSDRLAREQFLMTEDQIATLDDYELAMHIRRVQQIAHADRELNELLNERRRRQIVAVVGAEPDDDHLLG